jgi:hypothetical protein
MTLQYRAKDTDGSDIGESYEKVPMEEIKLLLLSAIFE